MTEGPRRKGARGYGSVYPMGGLWYAAVQLADGRKVKRKRRTQDDAERARADLLVEFADRLGYFYSSPPPHRYGSRPLGPVRTIPLKLRFSILERDGFRCRYCGATPETARLHIDHVIPVAAGGPTTADNLTTACEECNLGKGADSV